MDQLRLAPRPRGLAWFSAELLGRLPDDFNRLLPFNIGRFCYRSDFVARRSEEDLSPFLGLEQALRDTALPRYQLSRNLGPARNLGDYYCFTDKGRPIR